MAFRRKAALSCAERSVGSAGAFPAARHTPVLDAHPLPASIGIMVGPGGWVQLERAKRCNRQGFRCLVLLAPERGLWCCFAEWLVTCLLQNPGWMQGEPSRFEHLRPPRGQIGPPAVAVSGLEKPWHLLLHPQLAGCALEDAEV